MKRADLLKLLLHVQTSPGIRWQLQPSDLSPSRLSADDLPPHLVPALRCWRSRRQSQRRSTLAAFYSRYPEAIPLNRQQAQRGAFIVIEGMDGSGGTTQTRLLAERLRASHSSDMYRRQGSSPKVMTTNEPTRHAIGQLIRERLATTAETPNLPPWSALPYLFAADRAQHVATTILPALERGEVVVSDRYYHSSMVYQQTQTPMALPVVSGADSVRNIEAAGRVSQMNHAAGMFPPTCPADALSPSDGIVYALNAGFPAPDLTIVLDLPWQECWTRINSRGEPDAMETTDRLQRQRRAYSRLCDVLSARGECILLVDASGSVDDVLSRIVDVTAHRFPGLLLPL